MSRLDVSEPMVLRSNAGYYIGRTCSEGPYDRLSCYYREREDAANALKSFRLPPNLVITDMDEMENVTEQEDTRRELRKASLEAEKARLGHDINFPNGDNPYQFYNSLP